MENNALFSIIHTVCAKNKIKGIKHQAFIDRLIGHAHLLHYLFSQLYSKREDFDTVFYQMLELIVKAYTERDPQFLKRDEQKEKEGIKAVNQAKLSFFTNISHEFRTPLTLILAPIKEIIKKKEQFQINEELSNKMDIIKNNSFRLMKLVNQSFVAPFTN